MLKPLTHPFRKIIQKRIATKISRGEIKMLFIVGHMRSGSSLLVHLLATNPSVMGYGETHHRYCHKDDLAEVAFKIIRSFHGYRIDADFYLDKILHSEKCLIKIFPEIRKSSKFVFLVREPQRAIPSILSRRLEKTINEQLALSYYLDRLSEIILMAQSCSRADSCFLTYQDIVSDCRSETTLEALTKLLGLDKPLMREYSTIWSTGQKGIGDSSSNIHAGKIVSRESDYPIAVSTESLAIAQEAYTRCIGACAHLSPFAK